MVGGSPNTPRTWLRSGAPGYAFTVSDIYSEGDGMDLDLARRDHRVLSTLPAADPFRRYLEQAGVCWGGAMTVPHERNLVVVLGNAYGLMQYQEPLARGLCRAGFNALWTSVPGQEGAKGTFGLRDGIEFLHGILTCAAKWNVAFVSHCASTLGVIELIRAKAPANVKCLLAYGPLLTLPLLRARAERRLQEAGVVTDLPEAIWDFDFGDSLAELTIPTLIAHSSDPHNRRRGSVRRVRRLTGIPCVKQLVLREVGYDDDSSTIYDFLPAYISFLRQHLS